MKRFLTLVILVSLTQPGISQEKGLYTLKWGVSADYSHSGSINAIVAGPSLFVEKEYDRESGFWHVFTLNAGATWSKNTKSSPVTSVGYYLGKVPGVVFGVSTQQYYNIETIFNNTGTDVRLSGEVILALFGFIGYRYQHPLLVDNEAMGITRHAFFIRIPIPIKTISKK